MKNFKFILFIFLFFLALDSFAQSSKELDTFGYYYIEKPTKSFTDISVIHLSGDYGKTEKPPFFGLIRLKAKNAKDFHLLKPHQKDNFISFTTKSVDGISYKFSGNFTSLYDEVIESRPGNTPEGIVLKGILTKFKGKKKIAEQKVGFNYFAGD